MIGFGSLNYSDNFIQLENEWNLPESNTDRIIQSIVVNPKDNLFIAVHLNRSIIEMKESGEFIFELILKDENGNKFLPHEMTFISSEILGVKCVWGYYEEGKIFFWRDKNFLHF